jgi:hypothetical protein
MKLQELSQEELSGMIINLYNNYRLLCIEFETMHENDDSEKDRLTKEYISQILEDGIDQIILQNCSSIIGDLYE